jgi:signal transduction histidine kinase
MPGLGLAITKSILDLHRSRLTVESKLGTGTIFRFTLPLARREAEDTRRSAMNVTGAIGRTGEP